MSKDIINRIVKSKDSLTAYEKAYNSKNELFKQIVKGELEVLGRKNLFDFLEELAKNKELELNFKSIDKFIEGKKYVGFSFTNKKLIELNLKINFEFNASKHRDFFFGFWYIDRELVAQNIHPEIYKVIQEKFEDMFKGYNQPFTTKSTLCFKEYAEYKNWNKIGFTKEFLFGDFKEDIRNKVEKMIEIIL
jgi:hypothetical protein